MTDETDRTGTRADQKNKLPTEKAFQEFLKTSQLTEEDVNEQVELQVLSNQIQRKITNEAPPATAARNRGLLRGRKGDPVHDQTDARRPRDRQQRQSESRSSEDGARKRRLARELEKSRRRNTRTTRRPKAKAACRKDLPKNSSSGAAEKSDLRQRRPANSSARSSSRETTSLIEVVKLNPEKVKTLAEVKARDQHPAEPSRQQEIFSEFVADYQSKWSSRTFCASGFAIERAPTTRAPAIPRQRPKPATKPNPKAAGRPNARRRCTDHRPAGNRAPTLQTAGRTAGPAAAAAWSAQRSAPKKRRRKQPEEAVQAAEAAE